jgi:hypothetical protein
MTIQQDIDALVVRIDKARVDCEVWRASGPREKYLEVYFLVEALTAQLDQCLQSLRRLTVLPTP